MAACPSCGHANPPEARFCSACAGPLLATQALPRELRKTVTIVFSDVTNSTRLGESLDPESHRRVMGRYFDATRTVLERHGGTVEKFIGDAVMAVFGIPVVHEDDALRAVRAAAEMRAALAEVNGDLRRGWGLEIAMRTGVNTGEVVAGDAGTPTLVTGDAVVVAKRLEETAGPNEIRLGANTYRLVREAVTAEPLEPVSPKGKGGIPAWRLLEVGDVEGTSVRLDSPLVGRTIDLAALEETFELVERERSCRLFTVLGPAGIGKSRLTHEFVESLDEHATVLRGHCLPYGDGITFWPLVEVVKQAAGLLDLDSPEEARQKIGALLPPGEDSSLVCDRVAAAVGRGRAGITRPEETFWAVRRLFEALAAERPLVVVIDDLQWAESTFLDLLEYIAGWTTRAPVLLCCQARPDLLELRPAWGLPRPNATSILLEPLREDETDELIRNLLGRLPVPAEAHDRVIAAAEGNPLFVEELLRMMLDEGLLTRENGSWAARGGLGELAVPPTIHALLSARLDRLDPEERGVIQRASVAGQVFWWGAVAELSPRGSRPAVGAHLQSLVRKDLIRREHSGFAAEDAFRFGHILIRDAAYAALPKQARADLHERLAAWLARKTTECAAEYEEIVGYHLEQSVRYRGELGRRDDSTAALARDAGRRLASAGRRAVARADGPAAVSLLTRASELLRESEPERLELLVDLGEALHEIGELQRAHDVLEEAVARAAAENERVQARARLELGSLRLLFETEAAGAVEELRRAAERAVVVFESHGDERGLAQALARAADAHWLRCRVGPMEPLLERAKEHAARADDARTLTHIRYGLVRAAALGPMPVTAAIRRCEQVLAESAGDRVAEATTANALAYLEAMRGRFEQARALAARSRAILQERGMVMLNAVLDLWAGEVEMMAGNPVGAERLWRSSYETLDGLGEKGNLSTIAAFLAGALYAQGHDEGAERLTEMSERTASPDDVISHIAWRVTRSKLRARQGDVDAGERLAREAVARADETDWPILRGAARASLAEVLLAADKPDDAARVAKEAVAVYEAKGNIVAAAQARSLLERTVRDEVAPGDRAS
jgi:class 3 adenylate cyclase/tetratricopeptide (TPR) repeat protein